MQSDQPPTAEQLPFNELSVWEQVVAVGFSGFAFLLFAVFFYFFFWRMIKAQIETPKELKRIRIALERIADKFDNN